MQAAPRTAAAATRSASGMDLYAAALSLLCLMHCLALPLITTLFPLLGQMTENERVHQGLVLLAAPATLWAVWKSRPHKLFVLTALGGLTLMMLAGFVEAVEPVELWLTILGATCLAAGHLWRWSQPPLSAYPKRNHLNLSKTSNNALNEYR